MPMRDATTEGSTGKKAEGYLLALCLKRPDYVDTTLEQLGETPMTDPGYAEIFRALVEAKSGGMKNLIESIYEKLPETLQKLVGKLLSDGEKVEPANKVFNSCWRRIKIERIDKQLEDNRNKVEYLDNTGLMLEQMLLEKEKKQLQQGMNGAVWLSKS